MGKISVLQISRNLTRLLCPKLSDVMEIGFEKLQLLLQGCIGNSNEYEDEDLFEEEIEDVPLEMEVMPEPAAVESDLFSILSDEIETNVKLGPEMPLFVIAVTIQLTTFVKYVIQGTNNEFSLLQTLYQHRRFIGVLH